MPKKKKLVSYFGLPVEVKFCKRCVFSNQKPSSIPESFHRPGMEMLGLVIDEGGIGGACRYAEMKDIKIDWSEREKYLLAITIKNKIFLNNIQPGMRKTKQSPLRF